MFAFSGITCLRTSRYHGVDSLHTRKFSNSASLFLTVHLIGILEHSRALRGECTKWLVKKSLLQSSARFLLLTFFHFEPLIFVDSFFGFQISRILCCLFPRDKKCFQSNSQWEIFKVSFFLSKKCNVNIVPETFSQFFMPPEMRSD